MKLLLSSIFAFSLILFSTGCGTKPFLKTDELPKNIQYYSEEKQFKVNPEWYWRIRPLIGEPTADSTDWNYGIIGRFHFKDKNGYGLVIGEYNSEEKFYVVKWDNHGYFFINEKDYLFAEKFKKYLVPINYDNHEAYGYGYEYSLLAYYQDNLSPEIQYIPSSIISDAVRSSLNLKTILKMTLRRTLLMNNKYNSKYSDLLNTPIQISSRQGFTNEFLKFTSCPLFSEYSKFEFVNSIEYLAVDKIGTQQYTNTYGMVIMGNVYQTKYVIVRWGKVFYAFPCE